MKNVCVFAFACLLCLNISLGQTFYFLAADSSETYSFVVPLTDPNHIAHARDLVADGPGIGGRYVAADVACGTDGINRNYVAPSKPLWHWHITNVIDFFDVPIPELPTFLNLVIDCEQWNADNGTLSGLTIVEELGTDPKHWRCDFADDDTINMKDMAVLGQYWLRDDCGGPDWCGGTDLNHNNIVDMAELEICLGAWLSPYAQSPIWFSAWNCPRQCHGDADCQVSGLSPIGILAVQDFLDYYNANRCPLDCDDIKYDPQYDFDRDCDVDEDDIAIIERWGAVPTSQFPTDCPILP